MGIPPFVIQANVGIDSRITADSSNPHTCAEESQDTPDQANVGIDSRITAEDLARIISSSVEVISESYFYECASNHRNKRLNHREFELNGDRERVR
jgi:hypothetical protein